MSTPMSRILQSSLADALANLTQMAPPPASMFEKCEFYALSTCTKEITPQKGTWARNAVKSARPFDVTYRKSA